MRKFYLLLFIISISAISAKAQVSLYSFSQSNGTYTPITGGTVIVTATEANPIGDDSAAIEDFTYAERMLPFPVNVGNMTHTTFRANSNGWVGFGPGSNTNTSAPISSTLPFGAIVSGFSMDLMGISSTTGTTTTGSDVLTAVGNTAFAVVGAPITGTGIPAGSTILSFTATTITISQPATSTGTARLLTWPTGQIRFEAIGVAPNRTLVIQYSGMSGYTGTSATDADVNSQLNFQIRIEEAGGNPANQTISIVYGLFQHPGTAVTGQVGLRGTSNTDFNNRTTTTNWSATTAGATSSASVTWGAAINPPSGLTFTWTPPAGCVAPADQATALVLTPNAGGFNGSFTPAASAPTGYLVIQTTSPAPPTAPVNGTTYTPGSSALGGTVISSGPATTFTTTNLNQATTYYYWVYTFNNTACTAGPVYNTASPLTQSATTLACTVIGTKSVGPTGIYTSLTQAMADIMTNGLAGPVILELQSTYLSTVETFPINIGVIPCALNTLTIRPETGAVGLVITSANANSTIDLNGASYVTIDGRPGGTGNTSQLTITNTGAGTASTVRFMNDALANTITYTTMLGSTATTNGVVLFAGGLFTGNDNNIISNNTISAAGATNPLNGIISLGSSATLENNANTVINNSISDIFSAGSVFNGISIGTGNSAWTITNNRIFQTAARTVTTANTSTGITVTSGSGYTISNNVIGFANAAGTGVTSLSSTVALRYIGINGTFTTGGVLSTIANNTIAGIALATSSGATTTNGILAGINVTLGNATISGNTIGGTTGINSLTATSTTSGGLLVGINSSSSGGTISITNNTIGGLSSSGTTATTAGSVTGINVSGVAASMTITGNTIGNATADNMRGGTSGLTTGSSLVTGINAPSTSTIANYSNNTVQNLSSFGTGASGFVRGIQSATSGTTTSATISGNTVTNLKSDNTNTTFSNGQLAAVGIYFAAGLNGTVSDNNISNISLTNTGTAGTNAAGISVAAASGSTLTRNKICDISNASTSVSVTLPGTVSGIFVRGQATGTTLSFINNMISLGAGQSTNTAFIGIWSANSNNNTFNNNVYFNTVNIAGTATLGAQPSFAFLRGDLSTTARTQTVDIRNNIFHNARTSSGAGTGKHYAISNNYGATVSTTGWGPNASNYNVLNSANPATVGHWTTDQTFAGWKAASNSDQNSFSGIPVTFASPCDLHLNMGLTPTQIESAGQPIAGITTDYDNQVRPGPAGSVNGGARGPDIGADEFDGVILDLTGPTITVDPVSNTLCTANRNISATISDISNVEVAPGTRPRLYYKKSTNANALPATNDNTTDGWKWVEATNTTSPFNFTLDASKIFGGVAAGDVIEYFVVAQDQAVPPNVGISSGTFNSTPGSVSLAAGNFPISGTIASYTVVAGGLSGAVTIGAAGTYPTLTGAGGLFAAINASGLNGNVTANIIDATVTETGANGLNQMIYACGGPYNLLIKPDAGVTSTLTGTINNAALIKILSNNVTIDGSNNGTNTRDLTITNTSTTGPSVLLLGSTGTIPIMNSAVRNAIIINGSQSASAVVVSDGTGLGNPGYFNNITIQNNSVQRAYIGVYTSGVPATGNGSGLLVTGNDLSTAGANSIRLTALYSQGVDGATFSNNTIGGIANTLDATNVTGIWFATSVMNSTISGNTVNGMSTTSGAPRGIVATPGLANSNIVIAGNTITGLTSSSSGTTTGIYVFTASGGMDITNNVIRDIKNTSTSGFGANGIQLGSSLNAADIDVNNNFISDVTGFGFDGITAADNGYGIMVGSGGGYNIDFNTVNMNTNQIQASGLPAAINISSGVTTTGSINIRNNIFANTMTLGTNRHAIISGAPNTVFGVIDNNDYFTTGPNLGRIDGIDRATLADIQAGFGGNMNSVNVMPVFVSATDLHLSNAPGANFCLNGSATPLPAVPTDIDNQIRSTGIPPNGPDMGADEFTPVSDAVATPSAQTVCSGTPINMIVLSGSAVSYNWTRDNTATVTGIPSSGTGNIGGSLTNTTNAPVTVTFTITPVYPGGCNGPAITATVLVNPTPNAIAAPASQSICSGATIAPITLSGGVSGTTFTWTRDNTGTVTGISANGTGNITGSLTNTTGAPVTVTFTITPTANTCTGTPTTATVTVNPPPVIAGTLTQPSTCVSNDGAISIILSGTPGPYSFVWTGTGVNPSSQNQTGLTVGSYTVVVTDVSTGCSSSATYSLVGPGGCSTCPIIGSVATNPSIATCQDQSTTITASGLTGMGVTYGIQFKHSTTALANPYVGGTTIATVPNAGLTGGGSTATSNTSFTTPGSYFIYAVLSPTPADPACRPSAVVNLQVNPTPNAVATPSAQTTCSGATITTIALTGAVSGTTYSWTRDQTVAVTGIAASGSGNISGALTNTTLAPVVVTFTITPTANGCPGAPITATVTVNPIPTVNPVADQTVCNGSSTAAITFSGTVAGTVYNWTNNTTSIGLAASGTGNIPSFVATNTGTTPVIATITATPTYTNAGTTCTGTPVTFTITVNPTPTVSTVTNQTVCNGSNTTAVAFSGSPAGTVFNWTNNTTSIGLAASGSGNIPSFTATNTGSAPVTGTITVTPSFTNGSVTCTGTPTTFTITVNPTPTVNAMTNQVVCPGSATTAVIPAGTVTGTVFNWTNSNTSIGLGASGTGTIPSFTAVNTGANPVTSTVTVTPSYTNNGVTCTGTPRTFTITVNTVPTITCPANITVNSGAGLCGAVVTYPAATVTGTPAPTVTYSIASGATFPVGLTTVTATATSACGTATCTFTVRVNDTQAPVITCPANMTVNTPVGSCTAPVTYTVTGTDNCPGVVVTRTAGPASGAQFPIGTTTVTHTATDAAGNTVTCSFTVTVVDVNLPAISVQPSNRTVCNGASATFSVTASNVTSYQWQQFNGTTFVNIAGATGSSYTVTNANNTSMNTNTFRVVLNGACSSVTSNNATLFVNLPATVVLTAVPPASITPGFTTTLVATPSTLGGTYQWFKNGQLIANTTATLGPISVDDLATYRVVYTDANGCVATSADLTVTAMVTNRLWVYPNPNRGQFQVRYFNAPNDVATIMVHDALGQRVYRNSYSNTGTPYSVMSVDLGFKANGIYIVSLVNGAGKIVSSVRINVQKFQ